MIRVVETDWKVGELWEVEGKAEGGGSHTVEGFMRGVWNFPVCSRDCHGQDRVTWIALDIGWGEQGRVQEDHKV